MKKIVVLFVMLFATFVTFAQASKSAQDQQACEYARRKNTAEVWQDYLRQFPQGACSFEAKSELKSITAGSNLKITIISDKRSSYCKEFVAGIQAELKNMFPQYTQEVIDYSNPQARNLYNKLVNFGFTTLPIVTFDISITKRPADLKNIERLAVVAEGQVVLKLNTKFDPTKEICDNGIDDTGNGKIDYADDDCKGILTWEATTNLSEMLKLQLITREDPNVGHFVSSFSMLGFKTKEATFASSPQNCQYSKNYQFDKYACGKSYAYAVDNPQTIQCNSSGVGNFVWAVAIDQNVPEDWKCVCMDANFNINHGRCH